ncbi:MAG TPA: DUF4386 family protein [Thermoplasmata archaeon]|nr:DUF4386 family protein [Thermoplasmata archaeon]
MSTIDAPAIPQTILERTMVKDAAVEPSREALERSALRWGGLAGVIGAIVFLVSIVYQVAFVGTNTTAAGAGPVIRFPGLQTQIIVGQTLFLVGVLLFVPLYLALFRALRSSSLAAAPFGAVLSFLGLAVLAVESEPNVAMSQISAQYHAAGATAAQQANAVQIWQATQGMFNQFDTCAYIFLSVGFIVLGLAMLRSPSFGKGFTAVSGAFGVAGLFALASFPVDSAAFSPFALLTFAAFPLLFGWKAYKLSGARPALVSAAPA